MRINRPPSNVPATDAIIDTSNASAGVSSGNIPGMHDAKSDLPAPGGPTMHRLCPPRRRDLKRALGRFLPLHHFHVGTAFARFGDSGFGGAQQRLPLQMIQQPKQIRRSDHFNLTGPRRFGPLHRRTYQPHAAR